MPVCAVAIDALPDRDVPGHADLPGQRHVVFNRHAARHAHLRREQDVAADGDAVRDLDEVVDLGARADPRLAHGRTIDGRVGADLDVVLDDDAADLRNLVMRAVGAAREAEAVAADDGAVLEDDAVAEADALADRDARVQHAVVADLDLPADRRRAVHDRARADARAVADDGERPDRHAGAERHVLRRSPPSRCTPGGGRHGSAKSSTARANARYGWRARSIAHGAASAVSPRMTAEARVVRSAAAYLGLVKKVRSPGTASSIPATPRMSMSGRLRGGTRGAPRCPGVSRRP